MCDCPNPDVLTEWTGYQGIEHHMCCQTTQRVVRDDAGTITNLTELYRLYDLPE